LQNVAYKVTIILSTAKDFLSLRGVGGKGGVEGKVCPTNPGGKINILNKKRYFHCLTTFSIVREIK
jgi:hypothetical protein